MQQFTCRIKELDEETQDYLQEVYALAGKRCPGVYHESPPGFGWGKVALGVGPFLMFLGLIWAGNSNKSAYATAMLFAGLVMLGGWLTWFGLRSLVKSRNSIAGQFVYFDPTHVYQVQSSEVTVTEIATYHKVAGSSSKKGGPPCVTFTMENEKIPIRVSHHGKAELVERYYNAILDLEEHEDSKWNKLDPVELGGVAKHIAVEGGYPISADSARLKVAELPQEPRAQNPGVPGLGLMVTFTFAAVLFFLGLLMFKPMRDDAAFETAKANRAPGLRGYLMDDRNTGHKDEAKKLLAEMYVPVIDKVNNTVPETQLPFRTGLVALLESLKTAPQPVVSMQVIETGPEANPGEKEGREKQLREGLSDALGLYVGQELIAFVKNPDDKKAHFELSYTVGANNSLTWKLAVRTTPDGEAAESQPKTLLYGANLPEALKTALFQELFRQLPPALPPPVFDDGNW